MEVKVSKAQIEVWEWKEKAYEQIKGLSSKERIKLIRESTEKLAARLRRNKAA